MPFLFPINLKNDKIWDSGVFMWRPTEYISTKLVKYLLDPGMVHLHEKTEHKRFGKHSTIPQIWKERIDKVNLQKKLPFQKFKVLHEAVSRNFNKISGGLWKLGVGKCYFCVKPGILQISCTRGGVLDPISYKARMQKS